MPMKLVLENVLQLSDEVFKAQLSREDREYFKKEGRVGQYRADVHTVIHIRKGGHKYLEDQQTLMIDGPYVITSLHMRSPSALLIIDDAHEENPPEYVIDGEPGITIGGEDLPCIPITRKVNSTSGDEQFLTALKGVGGDVEATGILLLEFVRTISDGALNFHPKSGKFVEYPNNFWTVRIQPRDRSLRIAVRGEPNFHATHAQGLDTSLTLKKDMGSYSAFKVSKASQVAPAIAVLQSAFAWRSGMK